MANNVYAKGGHFMKELFDFEKLKNDNEQLVNGMTLGDCKDEAAVRKYVAENARPYPKWYGCGFSVIVDGNRHEENQNMEDLCNDIINTWKEIKATKGQP